VTINHFSVFVFLVRMEAHDMFPDMLVQTDSSLWHDTITSQPTASLAGRLMDMVMGESKIESTLDMLLDLDLSKDEHQLAREEFVQTEAFLHIFHALNHFDNANVHRKCCKVIMSLTHNNPRIKDVFMNAGATEAVVRSMTAYPKDTEIQSYGCCSLRNLSARDCSEIVDAGGLAAMVVAMREHPEDLEIQMSGSICLYKVAATYNGTFVETMIEMGCGAVLAEAHQQSGKSSKTEEFAKKALYLLYCT
jgi:hypothetical protein